MKITDWIKQWAIMTPSYLIALILIKGIFFNGEMGFLEIFIILLSIALILLTLFLKQTKIYYTILCLGLLSLMVITYCRASNGGSILGAIYFLYLMYRLHMLDEQKNLE